MSECYLLTLLPMEPYFFGNEKTFSFAPQKPGDNRYFIKSERMPLQTTILGALRYLLMPVKKPDYRYTHAQQKQNEGIIGPESFRIDSRKQSFGVIEKISPVFLIHGRDRYVRTPFDHDNRITDCYTPMTDHCEVITDQGMRWFFPEFAAKSGIADSYMHTKNGALVAAEDIFTSEVRVGIDKGRQEKGYYKKQRMNLRTGWAFGVYVTLNTRRIAEDPGAQAAFDALAAGTVACLGQNKSAFSVRIRQEENHIAQDVSRLLQPGAVYCLGDTLAGGDIYESCLFAATRLRDFRAYRTAFVQNDGDGTYVGTVSKGACLYKLLCAGSILIPDPQKNIAPCLENGNCRQIGFNITIPNAED